MKKLNVRYSTLNCIKCQIINYNFSYNFKMKKIMNQYRKNNHNSLILNKFSLSQFSFSYDKKIKVSSDINDMTENMLRTNVNQFNENDFDIFKNVRFGIYLEL